MNSFSQELGLWLLLLVDSCKGLQTRKVDTWNDALIRTGVVPVDNPLLHYNLQCNKLWEKVKNP